MTEADMHLRSLQTRLALTQKETKFWREWALEQEDGLSLSDALALRLSIVDVENALANALAAARHIVALKSEETP